ncbi:uncharacterized protein TRAVEDRAFT_42529 [Trametes versicolor FP-101664 SS1]|uniref:uncharacterized protein n=1 Tax=Trametes versicolor (strain FP-101664) TaxID=717944 RepID=UPI0004621BDC|nr:uncharacterized protein TRAVEDRAFT_42529 [Trametes versicolor FP-101664 SS1]EIW65147.1 hypothetical protein TRAVEDRAFT_42529 [Trametes versicolor FP-101664 SS1]
MYLVPAAAGVSPVTTDPWAPYPELDVRFWEYQKHLDAGLSTTPSTFIPASLIRCQLTRGICTVANTDTEIWVTTTLDWHGISLAPGDNDE